MSKYEEALKNLSCDVSKLCKEMGWEMDNKDIEVMKELIQVKSDLEAKLAESEKSNEYFADRVEKADKEIKENYRNYNKLVEEYNQLKQQLAESESRFQAHKQNDARIIQDQTDLIENLKQQVKEKEIESLKVDGVLNEELEEKDYTIIKPFLKETLTIEEIKHIIKNLSDFNLRQTSFHDIQKNDVIFNAYINKHIAYKKCLDLLDLVDQDKISFAVEQLEKVKEDILLDISIGVQREWISNKIDNQIKQLKEMK